MKTTLIGYTGFVGSNLSLTYNFNHIYNSKNISDAFDIEHDLLIYSGVPAEKYLANNNPEKDMQVINAAIENIKKLRFKKLVLISTIDIYKTPVNVDENSEIVTDGLHAYGLNRYTLEKWVKENIPDYLIVRLPALFGENLKKNFIYDIITIIPFMLKEDKFNEIKNDFKSLNDFYTLSNGFYKLNDLSKDRKLELKTFFKSYHFNAIKFTDSRNKYPFYNLKNLWQDINAAIKNNIKILNIAAEPISAADIYEAVFNKKFFNETSSNAVNYDMKSIHYKVYNGENGYLYLKDKTLEEIVNFVKSKSRV